MSLEQCNETFEDVEIMKENLANTADKIEQLSEKIENREEPEPIDLSFSVSLNDNRREHVSADGCTKPFDPCAPDLTPREDIEVIIPCTGDHTRLGTLGDILPNHLLPVEDGITVLQNNITALKEQGFKKFTIVINEQHVEPTIEALNLDPDTPVLKSREDRMSQVEARMETIRQLRDEKTKELNKLKYSNWFDTSLRGLYSETKFYKNEDRLRDIEREYIESEINLVVQSDFTDKKGVGAAVYSAMQVTNTITPTLIVVGDVLINNFATINAHGFEQSFVTHRALAECESTETLTMVDRGNGIIFDHKNPESELTKVVNGIFYIRDSFEFETKLAESLTVESDEEYEIYDALGCVLTRDAGLFVTDVTDYKTLHDLIKLKTVFNVRPFNTMTVENGTVQKFSDVGCDKIQAEANWYLRGDFLGNAPELLDFSPTKCHYTTELIGVPSVGEKLTFTDYPVDEYATFVKNALALFEAKRIHEENHFLSTTIASKNEDRVACMSDEFKLRCDVQEFLQIFFDDVRLLENDETIKMSRAVLHGDPVYSNVFDDDCVVKLIDPNGHYYYGSHYYEIGKMMASALYNYDAIAYGMYLKDRNGVMIDVSLNTGEHRQAFLDALQCKYQPKEIALITLIAASLLLTSIPLHVESSQELIYKKFLKATKDYITLAALADIRK